MLLLDVFMRCCSFPVFLKWTEILQSLLYLQSLFYRHSHSWSLNVDWLIVLSHASTRLTAAGQPTEAFDEIIVWKKFVLWLSSRPHCVQWRKRTLHKVLKTRIFSFYHLRAAKMNTATLRGPMSSCFIAPMERGFPWVTEDKQNFLWWHRKFQLVCKLYWSILVIILSLLKVRRHRTNLHPTLRAAFKCLSCAPARNISKSWITSFSGFQRDSKPVASARVSAAVLLY